MSFLLRKLLGNRRKAPRYEAQREVRLVAGLTVLDKSQLPKQFIGHTRNISEAGLSVVLPSISTEDLIIASAYSRMLTILVLPTRTINMYVSVVYRELIKEGKPESGHRLGLRIVEMSEHDRTAYQAYLRTLR